MLKNRTKILYSETYTHIAGGQKGLFDLVCGIDKTKFEPVVQVQGPGSLSKALEKQDIRVIFRRLEPFKNRWLPFSWRIGVWPFKKLIAEVRPQLVHSNHLYVGRYSGRAARLCGVPALVTLRLVHPPEVYDRQNRWDTIRAHHVAVSNSYAGKEAFSAQADVYEKIRVVQNGIDLKRFCPQKNIFESRDAFCKERQWPSDAVILMQVASMVPQKGGGDLMDAFLALRAKNEKLRLVLVGGRFGNTYNGDNLLKAAEAAGVGSDVHLTQFVWDVPTWMNISDIMILASRDREGLPRCLIEGMACGKPLVGTRVGGVTELIEEGINGFLIQPNDVSALTDRLGGLIKNAELRMQMGNAGLKRAQAHHDFDDMVAKYEAIYDELAGHPPDEH